MTTIEKLKNEIDKIKERNARVEKDKAWETSLTRKLLILAHSYLPAASSFVANFITAKLRIAAVALY